MSIRLIRCCICQGQGILSSSLLHGMVFKRQVEGDTTKAENCKIAVYTCPLDLLQTETKVSIIHHYGNKGHGPYQYSLFHTAEWVWLVVFLYMFTCSCSETKLVCIQGWHFMPLPVYATV